MSHNVCITGTGAYLPANIITNEDLAGRVALTPDDILKRTGIRERRKAGIEEATSDLATRAAT